MKPLPRTGPELLLGQADFVRALARSLLADRGAADDVAQEALVRGLERPPAVLTSMRAWLARVVRNLALQQRRGDARRDGRETSVARTGHVPSTADVVEREAIRANVVQAVLALEEPYRTVVLLRFYDGRSPREIAALLDVPVATVHTRTKRALARLRERLDREHGGRSAWSIALAPLARAPHAPIASESSPLSVDRRTPPMNLALKLGLPGLLLAAGTAYLLRSDPSGRSAAADPASGASAVSRPALAEAATAAELAPAQRVDARTSATSEEPPHPVVTAPPATLALSTGSLRLSITWSDGTPAAGVHANVQDVGRSSYEPLTGVTDAAGECTLDGLRAGKVWVTLDRKEHWERADVAAGEETALALQIPRGFDVEGVVVDASGAPVEGASMWLGDLWNGPEASFQIATSGVDGAFTIRSCGRLVSIWARADGHAPSLRRTLDEPEGSVTSVTLALTGPGAGVAGRVLDPGGQPVEGAIVLVDGKDMLRATPITLLDGRTTHLSHSGPVALRTDADGRFAVAGVRPGSVPLGVLAPGHSAWRGSVAAAAGETGETEIALAAGFRLSGTVRDAAGQPVAGRVFVFAASLSSQLCPTVMTGPDGAFELDGLAPGEVRVVADGQAGDAWTTLVGAAGDELSWDAMLGPEMPLDQIPMETAPWGR